MKKIVIISPFQFRFQRGIERFTYSLSNALGDLGIEIIIYSYSKEKAYWGKVNQKVIYRILPKFKYFEKYIAILFFRNWLKKDKPNHIILNFLYHGESHLPKNLSYTYVLNSPASQIPNRYLFIEKKITQFKNMNFVAVSEMVKREALPFINQRRITVIPNGVDTRFFMPNDKIKNTKKLYLITLAALEERKGIHYVIDALYKLGNMIVMNYEYHIFGDGYYFQKLADLVSKLNLENFVFIHSSSTDARGELQKADIFILPSKGEAFALAPIEALACGLPIIVSNFEPYPEFVLERFGKMVNRENCLEIIEAVNSIISNYYSMSTEARKFSLEYDWSNIASLYLKILSN